MGGIRRLALGSQSHNLLRINLPRATTPWQILLDGFQAALRELGNRAVDLTAYRLLELPGATLTAVPGYYRRHHIAAGPQGCSYGPGELRQLSKALGASGPAPRVVLS